MTCFRPFAVWKPVYTIPSSGVLGKEIFELCQIERRKREQRTRGANQKERALIEQEGQTKKREHTKNKRGKPKRERKQKTRGANLGVVVVQRRAHVKIWCAHKKREHTKNKTGKQKKDSRKNKNLRQNLKKTSFLRIYHATRVVEKAPMRSSPLNVIQPFFCPELLSSSSYILSKRVRNNLIRSINLNI